MSAAQLDLNAEVITANLLGGLMIFGAIYYYSRILRNHIKNRSESILVLVLMLPTMLLFIGIGITIPRMVLQERDEETAVKRDLSAQGFDVVSVRAEQDEAEIRTPDDGVMAYQYRADDDDGPYYLDGTTAVVIKAGTSFQATARLSPEDLPGAEGGQS